jgi:hypothetical protein
MSSPLAYLLCALGGAFLINALPHLVAGTMRRRFPTPFAHPAGRGLSSPRVNLIWGMACLALAWGCLGFLAVLDFHYPGRVLALAIGMLALGLWLARDRNEP